MIFHICSLSPIGLNPPLRGVIIASPFAILVTSFIRCRNELQGIFESINIAVETTNVNATPAIIVIAGLTPSENVFHSRRIFVTIVNHIRTFVPICKNTVEVSHIIFGVPKNIAISLIMVFNKTTTKLLRNKNFVAIAICDITSFRSFICSHPRKASHNNSPALQLQLINRLIVLVEPVQFLTASSTKAIRHTIFVK
nr:MAG TPA: hypothetical protein [Caudoviricetes sp.]